MALHGRLTTPRAADTAFNRERLAVTFENMMQGISVVDADLRIVADAGHSAFESGNMHELIEATDRFR